VSLLKIEVVYLAENEAERKMLAERLTPEIIETALVTQFGPWYITQALAGVCGICAENEIEPKCFVRILFKDGDKIRLSGDDNGGLTLP
jgi:hypothetical protein